MANSNYLTQNTSSKYNLAISIVLNKHICQTFFLGVALSASVRWTAPAPHSTGQTTTTTLLLSVRSGDSGP